MKKEKVPGSMNNTGKQLPPLVCFSGTDWWYHNRGLLVAQIMRRVAKQHTKVLYINSLGMRIPSLKNDQYAWKKIYRKIKSIIRYIRKDKESGMYIFSPLSVPFSNRIVKRLNHWSLHWQVKIVMFLLGIKKPVFYVGNLPAWEIVSGLERSYLIYENTDLYSAMPGIDVDYINRLDMDLIKNSDLIIYVNKKMWESGKKINKKSILLGHGVDYDLFVNSTKDTYIPEDITSIPRPIIGFYGDISSRTSDISLFEHVARELPDISLVLVGPISTDVSNLNKYDNVYFLGQKQCNEIPHYGKVFDVAIMAWNQNDWIENCNPVKTKEYLALGKPIVTVFYPEIKPYAKLVYVAKSHTEFIKNIKTALKENDPTLSKKRMTRVKNETWAKKTQILVEHIRKDLRIEETAETSNT